MGQTYLDLARAAGVAERLYRPAPVPIADVHRAEAMALLSGRWSGPDDGPLVLVHPGSGDNFQGRRWPAESFAQLADRLVRDEGAFVVVSGTAGETALVRDVIGHMKESDRAVDAAGRSTVLGLAALIERCALVVTNDTAPVHVASSLDVPVFAFYGPNTPRLYGPLSRGSYSFFRAIPCSPCLTNMNYKTSHCRMPVCIRDFGVDEVADRIESHLADRRAAAALRSGPRSLSEK